MGILFTIMLMIMAYGVGYYHAKGQIVINRTANKKMSEEMLKEEKRRYQELIDESEEALKNYNDMLGGM